MTKPFNEWTVLPHGKLTRLEPNLACVTGSIRMPAMGEIERRMTVVRMFDGRLVIYSAIALDEPDMQELERFGTPSYLIVPSDLHRMDAKIWKDRYPRIAVVAPSGAREKVEEVVPVDASNVHFGDPSVRFQSIAGTDDREAALIVTSDGATTLVLNDVIFNLTNRTGISGWLFKAIGLTGDEPHIAAPIRMRQVKDKTALRSQLLAWSYLPNLKRIIIAHGGIISNDAAATLRRIANDLQPTSRPIPDTMPSNTYRH